MKANIFIVWGGNKDLADEVSNQLEQYNEYNIQVGGGDQQQLYIANQIIEQIKRSSVAIILAESSNKNSVVLRPNLMFEWGYITAKFKPKNIHVFLIDFDQKELPSDLAGSWVNSIPKDERKKEEIANLIVEKFRNSLKEENIDKLDALENWPKNKEIIENHSKDPTHTEKEIASLILHSLQAAYYYDQLDDFVKSIKQIKTKNEILMRVKDIVISAAQFYIETENQQINATFEKFDDIIEKLEIDFDLNDEDKDIHTWLQIIKYDFIGLSYMFMADTDEVKNDVEEKKEYYVQSKKYFQFAIDTINTYKNQTKLDGTYIRIWEGYIYRNMAIISSILGEKENVKIFFNEACAARKDSWNYFSSNCENSILINNFSLEYYLIQIEQIRYTKSDALDKKRTIRKIKSSIEELGRKYSKQYSLLELVKIELGKLE